MGHESRVLESIRRRAIVVVRMDDITRLLPEGTKIVCATINNGMLELIAEHPIFPPWVFEGEELPRIGIWFDRRAVTYYDVEPKFEPLPEPHPSLVSDKGTA